MTRLPLRDSTAGTQFGHCGIDGLQTVDIVLFLQHLHEACHDQTTGERIITGTVMVKIGQTQCIGHNIQLEFTQLRQKILGKNQRISRSKLIFITQSLTLRTDKSGIKIRIVSDQHTVSDKFQKLRQYILDFRRTDQHIVGNSGQIDDFPVQFALRIHKGLETLHFLPVFHNDRTDFDNSVRTGGKSGGFQIEGNELLIKGHIPTAMDNNAVIHIVDIVTLTAVQDFNGIICTGNLGSTLPAFYCMQRIGKRLTAPMVSNSNGAVSPCCRLLDSCIRGC